MWKKMMDWIGKLSQNPKDAKVVILIFVLILLGTFATQCRAEESVLQFEGGSTVTRGFTPAVGLTIVWPEAGPKDADYQCGIMLLGTSETSGHDNPNQAALQCLLVDGYKKFDMGLGVAYLQNIDYFSGSHGAFSLMLGYRFTDKIGLVYRHWSNAGTVEPNKGRDMLLISYRF